MTAKTNLFTRIFIWLGTGALLLGNILLPTAAYAQANVTAVAPSLQVESRDGGLYLQWQGSVQAASTAESPVATTSYGGYLLPLQTLMVELPGDQAQTSAMAAVSVNELSSSPYVGTLTPAPAAVPPALDYVPAPTNTPYVEPKLPSAPLFVMADGMERNRHLTVYGFSPIYQDPNSGQILAVDNFVAAVAGANLAGDEDATLDPNNPANAALFAPVAALESAPGPTNPLANTNAIEIYVSNAGIQQLSGADLAAAGLTSPQASKLHLFYKGAEVPLDIINGGDSNKLDADDYLRFYAHEVGDTWNTQSVYWLTTSAQDGLRMGQRAVAAGGATTRNTAYEVGSYNHSNNYDTTLAGADKDNWFQANLRAETDSPKFEVTLPHQLPLNSALPTQLILNLTAYSIGPFGSNIGHRLQVGTSGLNVTDSFDAAFSGANPFQNLIRNLTFNKAADTWSFTLLKESTGRAIMFDAIDYALPVQLNFGSKGAIFRGVDGTWRYQLSGAPTSVTGGRALYDITDAGAPQRLTIPAGASFDFQDGATAHRYLLTGTGTFFTPTVQAHSAVNLGGSGEAHIVYITAVGEFGTALQPLVDFRKQQGYKVRVVDIQDIYDSWSYGMVDAKAIRSFLRFAAGKWSPAPVAAVLVGDTTKDPHNYLGYNNRQIVPPYIVNADPWIKYVPCESCYGQLNGDDPAGDYLIDIMIGRFPVVSVAELTIVVNKILTYEKDTDTQALWRSTSLQVADDDVRPDNTVDSAGPFVGSAEESVSLMPKAIRQLRNYYMAATDLSAVPQELLDIINSVKSWYVSDPDAALDRSVNLMNAGVGMVTYTGHSNHWQWARIVEDGNKWLFGLWEVLRLNNRNSPFISMSMTCFTSQFTEAAPDHFTLDEHLFLYGNGGAISTWGPTGFSIVRAHDTLQIGFHGKLWKSPPLQAKIGELTKAGYEEIFKSGQNFDVNKTFAVMGDPLTSARVMPVDTIYMPKLSHTDN